uniref:Xylulose kinase-1 n=1 Tax=Tanacetum cinerariifolium TaxID=118510 RepID=A0A6L2J5M5_TANCI|nr:hypothetical protein [Tanacetum cinerariifolium]
MVAYLTKSDSSEGFNLVIDFLNGSYIKYALTVNPDIYVSCIKQFWNTVVIKQDNDVTRLQALVYKNKVVVTEAAIREVLPLDDAEGVDFLPNEEIFAELSMSAKCTSWKEFSSAMASAVICLSTGDDTAAYGEVPTVSQEPSIPSPTPQPQPPQDHPSTSQGRIIDELDKDDVALMDDKEDEKKEEETKEDESAKVQEVVDVVTTAKLITKVVTATSQTVTAASTTISAAEPKVPAATITAAPVRVTVASTRRRKGVVIKDPKEESTTSLIIPADTKSKDKGKGIMVEEPKPLKKKQQVKMDEEYARKLHVELNKDIN